LGHKRLSTTEIYAIVLVRKAYEMRGFQDHLITGIRSAVLSLPDRSAIELMVRRAFFRPRWPQGLLIPVANSAHYFNDLLDHFRARHELGTPGTLRRPRRSPERGFPRPCAAFSV
jgi:hypothetical protein